MVCLEMDGLFKRESSNNSKFEMGKSQPNWCRGKRIFMEKFLAHILLFTISLATDCVCVCVHFPPAARASTNTIFVVIAREFRFSSFFL